MAILQHITALLLIIALSSSSVVKSPSNSNGNFELLILHNNDMHARFEQTSQMSGACTVADRDAGKCYGGFPRVAHVVKEARRAAVSGQGPPVLYLNAGDTYTGTAWFTLYKWQIAAEFINALHPDAVSLGNHEFDNGISGLTPFIENLTSPVLAANLILSKVPELEKEANLRNSIVIDIYGVKVGIIGYLTPETKYIAVPNEVEYIDEVVAIKREITILKNLGINILIALGHSGFVKDIQIAKECEGIDLVIGGHTNTFLWNGTTPDSEEPQGPYPTYVLQDISNKRVPVVQAYAYTKYLGKLHMIFDSNGNIISADGKPLLLDKNIPQDPEVLRIINRYRNDKENVADDIVGKTSVLLDGQNCKWKECNLGNLITDAMVYQYAVEFRGEYWTDAPIAIIQGGGIRSSISHAEMPAYITQGDLLTVMPFEGNLSTVTMNGTVLLQMLEYSVQNYSFQDFNGGFLQYSGLKVVYDLQKDVGLRVVKVEVKCSDCIIPKYSEIKNNKHYKVIMPGFVSKGGDGYIMFAELPKQSLSYSELDCTNYYLRQHSPIFPAVEGRISIINTKNALTDESFVLNPNVILLLSSIMFTKITMSVH